MSSHSSDVCVIGGTEDLSADPPTFQSDGLVRTPSSANAFSESCAVCCAPPAPTRFSEAGTNTDFPIDENVSALLERGIMDLMHAVAGSAFAQHTCDESRRGFALRSADAAATAARIVSDGLRRLSAQPPLAARQRSPPRTPETPPPAWLPRLLEAIDRADALAREIPAQALPLCVDTAESPSSAPAPSPANPPPLALSPHPPVPDTETVSEVRRACAERVAEVEAELCVLRSAAAETRAVLAREGTASVLPLYDELLKLRASRRHNAARDMDATAVALSAQERAFTHCLRATKRRHKALDTKSICEDVAVLEEMRKEIERLQRSVPRGAQFAVPGEKRLRSADDTHVDTDGKVWYDKSGAIDALLSREDELRSEVSQLRERLAAERSAAAQWQGRYETALREMQRSHDSPAIRALLREVEDNVSAAAARRESQLCRLFGWDLIELSERTVEMVRAGASANESPLTLALPLTACDTSAAVATSIVLAKKVIDGCAPRKQASKQHQTQPGQEQRSTTVENKEQEEETEVQSLKDDGQLPKLIDSECTKNLMLDAAEEPTSPNALSVNSSASKCNDVMETVCEVDLLNTGKGENEKDEEKNVEVSENKEDEIQKERESSIKNENNGEPFFYDDGGLWEE